LKKNHFRVDHTLRGRFEGPQNAPAKEKAKAGFKDGGRLALELVPPADRRQF